MPVTRIVVVREGNIYVPGEYDLVKTKLQAAKKGETPIRGYFELSVFSWITKQRLKSGILKIKKSYNDSSYSDLMTVERKTIQNSKVTSINQCSWEEAPTRIYLARPDDPWTKDLLKWLVKNNLMSPKSTD